MPGLVRRGRRVDVARRHLSVLTLAVRLRGLPPDLVVLTFAAPARPPSRRAYRADFARANGDLALRAVAALPRRRSEDGFDRRQTDDDGVPVVLRAVAAGLRAAVRSLRPPTGPTHG